MGGERSGNVSKDAANGLDRGGGKQASGGKVSTLLQLSLKQPSTAGPAHGSCATADAGRISAAGRIVLAGVPGP